MGLILVIVIVAAVVAHLLGGTRGMLMTAIFYGVVALPLVLAMTVFSPFRAAAKKPDDADD